MTWGRGAMRTRGDGPRRWSRHRITPLVCCQRHPENPEIVRYSPRSAPDRFSARVEHPDATPLDMQPALGVEGDRLRQGLALGLEDTGGERLGRVVVFDGHDALEDNWA